MLSRWCTLSLRAFYLKTAACCGQKNYPKALQSRRELQIWVIILLLPPSSSDCFSSFSRLGLSLVVWYHLPCIWKMCFGHERYLLLRFLCISYLADDWIPGRFWQAGSCWWTDSGDPPLSQHTLTSHHPFPPSGHLYLEENHKTLKKKKKKDAAAYLQLSWVDTPTNMHMLAASDWHSLSGSQSAQHAELIKWAELSKVFQ